MKKASSHGLDVSLGWTNDSLLCSLDYVDDTSHDRMHMMTEAVQH